MLKDKTRTLLWLCMLLLGLQLCVPAALHAADLAGAVDELSLRSTEPEAPADGTEVDEHFTVFGHAPHICCASARSGGTLCGPQDEDDRTGQELLAVAGFQPSAP